MSQAQVLLRLPQELKEAVEAEAGQAGLAASEYMREALADAVRKSQMRRSRDVRPTGWDMRARLEIRLSDKLKEAVATAAAAAGEPPSHFVRVALSAAIREYPSPTVEERQAIWDIRRQLSGAASNLNQLTYALHAATYGKSTPPNAEEFRAAANEVADLGRRALVVLDAWV